MNAIWQRLRKQWFRILLVGLSLGLVLGAVTVIFQQPVALARAMPLPVAGNEYEIAWLYPATNASTWERFVAGMRSAHKRLSEQNDNIEFEIGDVAFPQQATTVPEVAIRWRDSGKRLVFRWYKLTSSSKTSNWVEALAQRQPPPLAVIGGGNSYSGLELARQMKRVCGAMPLDRRPLLLLTTASADHAAVQDGSDPEAAEVELNDIYPGRTFRFCFSNRQMAYITTRFLWERDDLRPEADPVFQVAWDDDTYSSDLLIGYQAARRGLETQAGLREWAWLSGCIGMGTLPLTGGNLPGRHMRLDTEQQNIFSSVGTYHAPNLFESEVVDYLSKVLEPPSKQRRMFIVAGQFAPTRRFLEALARSAPGAPQRLVIVTGDTIAFNHIYRDRLAAWRTQDLPFPLVFFCHRNPIDAAAGFDRERGQITGTEDLLLFRDLVETLVEAFGQANAANPDASILAENIHAMRLLNGRLVIEPKDAERRGIELFSANGKRNGGTGEHVVYLRPLRQGDRVLSGAEAEVWTRDAAPGVRPFCALVDTVPVPDPQVELDRGGQP